MTPADMVLPYPPGTRLHRTAKKLQTESACLNGVWIPFTAEAIEREQLAQRRNAKWHRLKEKERMG